MRQAHFEHSYEEVYALVRQQLSDLRPADLKHVVDVAYEYGSSHRNSAEYKDFRSIVGVALPRNIKESALKPVFTQLFDYTPKGEKRSRDPPKYAPSPNAHPRVSHRVRGLALSVNNIRSPAIRERD